MKLCNWKIDISLKTMFCALFLVSSAVLLASLISEYVFLLVPCKLCNIQRILYGLLAFAALIGFFCPLNTWIRKACQGILLALFATASYHTLVQVGILDDRCSTSPQIVDASSFKALLKNPPVPCSSGTWKIVKVPVASLNAGLSLFLLGVISRRSCSRRNPLSD